MSNSSEPNQPAETPRDAAALDPYSEYLHLAEGHRPPHLYQLLEVELFCPHPEEIERAVRTQFRKIKPFEEHPDFRVRERIQDVMSHIATARTVLTDPSQKEEYDQRLAQMLKLDREQILQSRTAARAPEFQLEVIAGPSRVGARVNLLPDRVITIGSDLHCWLTLASSRMLPLHAQLEFVDGEWVLRNVNAKNVTLVNDQRCNEFLLADGDSIDIGGFRMRFDKIGKEKPDPKKLPSPLSLIIRKGPSVSEPMLNVVPPTSFLIGQCDTALWQLTHRQVSVHHARIESSGAFWEIQDLKSETGTTVNGDRITERTILHHRDQIGIGSFDIQVSLRR